MTTARKKKSPPVPPHIVERINAERRRLNRAAVLLRCLALGFDAGRDWNFSDGMEAVCAMLDDTVAALDSVELRRPVSEARDD